MARALASVRQHESRSRRVTFREGGIRVEIEDIDTSGNSLALLAQNRFQIVEGGVAAATSTRSTRTFRKSFKPIVAIRVTSPLHHRLSHPRRPEGQESPTSRSSRAA